MDARNFLLESLLEESQKLNEAGEEDAALGDATMPGQAQGQTNANDNIPAPPDMTGGDAGDTDAAGGDADNPTGVDPMDDLGDFSMDPDGGEGEDEDLPDHPDGLPEPDEVGGDTGENNLDGELNIHYNVLELSKMDRLMAKRKMYADYQSLRSTIRAFEHVIDKNEAAIDADIREYARNKATFLLTTVTDYLSYKFSYSSYEDNMQNYLIFTKALNDIMTYVNTRGEKGDEDAKKKAEDFVSDESKERTAARLDAEAQEKEDQELENMSPDELGQSEEEPDEAIEDIEDHLDAVTAEESGEENPEEGETAEGEPETEVKIEEGENVEGEPETEIEIGEEGEPETEVELEEPEAEEPETEVEIEEELEGEEPEDIDLEELETEITEEPEVDLDELEEEDLTGEEPDVDLEDLEELPEEGPDTDVDISEEEEELDLEELELPDFDEEEELEFEVEEPKQKRRQNTTRSKKVSGAGSEDIDIPEFEIEDI